MLLYTTVGTNDLDRAGRFYDAVLSALSYARQRQAPGEIGYAADGDVRCRFWVVEPFNREPATFGNGVTIALVAAIRAAVAAFLAAREGWQVVVDEVRERHVEAGQGAGHTADHVVRAHRN